MSGYSAQAGPAEDAAREVLKDRSIQRSLPNAPRRASGRSELGENPLPRGRPSHDPPPQREPPRFNRNQSSPFSGLGEFARVLLWGFVILAAIALVIFIVREMLPYVRARRQRKAEAEGFFTPDEEGAERPPGADLLDEADRLAARGAFAEAIHLLLLYSLRKLETRLQSGLKRSLTGREIIRRANLPKRMRDLLSVLVRASELGHFGGREADETEYKKCRSAFEAIAAEPIEPPATEPPPAGAPA